MRTAIDCIHRVKHDAVFQLERVIIGFVDRKVPGGVREQPLAALNFDDDLAAIYSPPPPALSGRCRPRLPPPASLERTR